MEKYKSDGDRKWRGRGRGRRGGPAWEATFRSRGGLLVAIGSCRGVRDSLAPSRCVVVWAGCHSPVPHLHSVTEGLQTQRDTTPSSYSTTSMTSLLLDQPFLLLVWTVTILHRCLKETHRKQHPQNNCHHDLYWLSCETEDGFQHAHGFLIHENCI